MSDCTFNENLKEAMSVANISTKELSLRTGIKEGTISNYLRSNGSLPSIEAGLALAEALNVSVSFLVRGFENPSEKEIDETNKNLYKRSLSTAVKISKLPESARGTLESLIKEMSNSYSSSKEN